MKKIRWGSLALLVASTLSAAELTPIARWQENPASWIREAYETQKAQAEKERDAIKIVFLGDSISYRWGVYGTKVFAREFAPYHTLVYANSGDGVQHMLYLIEKGGILQQLHPQLVVMLIGTNNLHRQDATPAEVAAGIRRGVADVRAICPDAKVLLFAIFPRAGGKNDPRYSAPIAAVNREISTLADDQNVFYCDIGEKFLNPDGTINRALLSDWLHPSEAGYQVWADAIRPYVQKFTDIP